MRARKLVIASGLLVAAVTAAPCSRSARAVLEAAPRTRPRAAPARSRRRESERAHTIYQAGKVQYDDKNYDAAIAQFRDAYKRDCSKHDLLIIISRAYELKGDKAEALRALETYVERVPNSPDIDDAQERDRVAEEADRRAGGAAGPRPRRRRRPLLRQRFASTRSRRGSSWASAAQA